MTQLLNALPGALAQGVNTGLMKVVGLALSNGVVALSGALLCQYQGYTDVNMGRGAVVIGLAAVVIGQAVLGRRGGRMAGAAGRRDTGRGDLLHRVPGHHLRRLRHRPSENVFRRGGGRVPGRAPRQSTTESPFPQ